MFNFRIDSPLLMDGRIKLSHACGMGVGHWSLAANSQAVERLKTVQDVDRCLKM